MSRPLLVTDCDEVLLHMVCHFRDWLGAQHAIDFAMEGNDFATALRRRDGGEVLDKEEIWRLLGSFFDTEMDSQLPIAGALEALAEIGRHADVVVLTNLPDACQAARTAQLRKLGVDVPVFTNQGPKGAALQRIVADHGATRAVFIDDIASHHRSASIETPAVRRLHLCGEPLLAPHIDCALAAGHAHARIDTWDEALPWVLAALNEEN